MNEFDVELKARRFVDEAGVSSLPIDLALYRAKVEAKLLVDDTLPAQEAGYTLRVGKRALIHVNGKDRPERQRFTECHEVAHLSLGLDSQHDFGSSWSYARRPANEIACDVFAAELLLPYRLFRAHAAQRPATIETVEILRNEFAASREATASRLAATSKEPCAYVLSEGGQVQHLVRSPSMRTANAWIARGTQLHSQSVAHQLRQAGSLSRTATVAGDVWFADWNDVALTESSYYSESFDQTLSVIVCEDPDELAEVRTDHATREDRSHGGLLDELDGTLPWPGGKRRR